MDDVHAGHRARLRKRLMDHGLNGFEDHEALELLLTYGIPRRDTNELAHRLMKRYGSLAGVFGADARDLMLTKDVGEQAAALLSLVGALMLRIKKPGRNERLRTPADVMSYCITLLEGFSYETLFAISLDKSGRVLFADRISQGTLDQTVIHPRLVVESALRHQAHSVILAHNHPSGDVRPSKEDREATEDIRSALATIGIGLSDHMIVGGESVFSFTLNRAVTAQQRKEILELSRARGESEGRHEQEKPREEA
ncbi:MAG: DNA repair protein RadC [Bacillota bacterium]